MSWHIGGTKLGLLLAFLIKGRGGPFVRAFVLANLLFFSIFPATHAGALSFMGGLIQNMKPGAMLYYEKPRAQNSQTMEVLEAAWNRGGPTLPKGGGEVVVLDGTALLADSAPSRGKDVVEHPTSDQIAVYVVREGDTLSEIASMFGVSTNTIRWANDIPNKGGISPGQKLVILPVSGVRYTVKKGDTIEKLAVKYKADAAEIREFNDIDGNELLALGDAILIPNGIIPAVASSPSAKPSQAGGGRPIATTPSGAGYFIRPVVGAIKTQGIHGYNGIDLGAPTGTSVIAAAGGEVVVGKDGWNGGYGKYIVIKHSNGTQTLYAHLSELHVSAGTRVSQGERIALSGNTGRSTGPHLHFEVRGAKNPF